MWTPQHPGVYHITDKSQARKIQDILDTLRAKDISKDYVEEMIACAREDVNGADDQCIDVEEAEKVMNTKRWVEAQHNKLVAKDIHVRMAMMMELHHAITFC